MAHVLLGLALPDGRITVNATTKKATNYPKCGGGTSLETSSGGPFTESRLYDATDNPK